MASQPSHYQRRVPREGGSHPQGHEHGSECGLVSTQLLDQPTSDVALGIIPARFHPPQMIPAGLMRPQAPLFPSFQDHRPVLFGL
jgi:hypothetical protein